MATNLKTGKGAVIDGIIYPKNTVTVVPNNATQEVMLSFISGPQIVPMTHYSDYRIDGVAPDSFDALMAWLQDNFFESGQSAPAGIVELEDGATIAWNAAVGDIARVTVEDSRTLAITNAAAGRYYTLMVTQDEVGGHELTLPEDSIVLNGGAMNTAPGATSILVALFDGEIYYWTIAKEVEE